MPPRRRSGVLAAPDHLTAENLETLAAAIAIGKRATVYLREPMPSLGLEAGSPAKVVSVQGNTVTIRPKGVDDELPFEAEELLMRRGPTPVASPATASPSVQQELVHQELEPGPKPTPGRKAGPVAETGSTSKTDPAAAKAVAAAKTVAAPVKRAGKRVPAGVSVTIHAGADNEWSVTVAHGTKRPGKAVPVTPDVVERAVRELGEESAIEAVESIIVAARNLAAARVDELSRQLEDAREALKALGAVG